MMRPLILGLITLGPLQALAATGGPDDYGYTYIDSDESDGPAYSWTDISSTGTDSGISDDGEELIPLPFTFWFYGQGYSQVAVGDGALLFGTDHSINNRNRCIPGNNMDGDDALILPMWDDLNAEQSSSGGVYWQVLGKAPERQLVIQYEDVPHYDADTSYTFQAILLEQGSQILLQYESVEGSESEYDSGASASVGIQADSSTGLEYDCESGDVLHAELAVLFDVACDDQDGDGAGACDGDCDDEDPTTGPTVAELDDGLDNDCDGLIDEDFIAVGDIVISEMLMDARAVSDEHGEWFELYNASERDIDLQGWSFSDSGGTVVVDQSVLIPAGGLALFAVDDDPERNGGLPEVDWVFDYDTMHLNNAGDELHIAAGGTVIDELSYEPVPWQVTEGASLSLDPGFLDAELNDSQVPWCVSAQESEFDYSGSGGGDYGTPGEMNPEGDCCHDDDGDGWDICAGDCDDDDPERFPDNPEQADLLDNDCDGFIDEDHVSEGSVVITEIMDDPYGVQTDRGEWFEVYNSGEVDLDLYAWQVSDSEGDGFVIGGSLVVPAGGYAVLAVDDDPDRNGDLPQVDYSYSYDLFPLDSFVDDDITLAMGELSVHTTSYSNDAPWPSELGRSTFLCPGLEHSGGSSEPDGWAATPASDDFDWAGTGVGDYGSPGQANSDSDQDGDGITACDGDCDDEDATVGVATDEDCDNGLDDDCDGAVDADDSDCSPVEDTGQDSEPAPEEEDDTGEVKEEEGCEGCASTPASGGVWLLGLLAGLWVRRKPLPPADRMAGVTLGRG